MITALERVISSALSVSIVNSLNGLDVLQGVGLCNKHCLKYTCRSISRISIRRSIQNCQLAALSRRCPNIQSLTFVATEDITALSSGLLKLKQLEFLAHSRVNRLDALAPLIAIQILSLGHCWCIDNIEPIKTLHQLTSLDVSFTSISSIHALFQCPLLLHLNLNDTAVFDLSPICGCRRLLTLNIRCTGITDLSPLQNCTKLIDLNVSLSPVEDLQPVLRYCREIKRLHLEVTNVPQWQINRFTERGVELVANEATQEDMVVPASPIYSNESHYD